jgi:hypothetical protein
MKYSKREKYYDVAVGYFRGDLNLLFQRLNYYLIATAFLIGGFITLIANSISKTGSLDIGPLDWYIYIIAAVGFIISLVFGVINYLNSLVIARIGIYIREIEKGKGLEDDNKPFNKMKVIGEKTAFSVLYILNVYLQTLAYPFGVKTFGYFETKDIFKKNDDSFIQMAPHTWLIPMFFLGIWSIILIYISFDPPTRSLVYGLYSSINSLVFVIMMSFYINYSNDSKKRKTLYLIFLVLLTFWFINQYMAIFHLAYLDYIPFSCIPLFR